MLRTAPAFSLALFFWSFSAIRTSNAYETGKTEKHWAVLVAGSSGYGNYRHQADVCHAYHIMISHGIPEEQVIVLAVNDIANSEDNPFPGKIFNKPTAKGTAGHDVYAGCKIDYSGGQVTPETFAKVLTGDSAGLEGVGTGKVLKSTREDHVFVNFVDHGGVLLIGFPRKAMHAKDLHRVLRTMHQKKMYKELVFYLEACESGSMFQDLLPQNYSIYATTAANAKESSWGTYCFPDDKVDGKDMHVCLGDLYSVNWMEDTDSLHSPDESLHTQFEIVKRETAKSHVMQFGDLEISKKPLLGFEGNGVESATSPRRPPSSARAAAALPSRDAALSSAYRRFVATGSDAAAAELIKGVQQRQQAKHHFERITRTITNDDLSALPPHDGEVDVECHYEAHKAYVASCGEWNEQSLAYSATFAQLCKHTSGNYAAIAEAVRASCA